MMHRFFVPPTWISSGHARLEGELAHQLGRVLRMSSGNEVILLDNSGMEYRVRLTGFGRGTVDGEVVEVCEGRGEPGVDITLYQGILKGSKFQWVLQKGTELGVTTFVPLICRRSVPRRQDSSDAVPHHRWSKIVTEAAEQSGRSRLPELRESMTFEDACGAAQRSGTSLMPWEREGSTGLRSVLSRGDSRRINIFIGPEGGFDEAEVASARESGVLPVSLGRRILRSETAGIAAVAAVLYEAGELGA